ncbi:hypothetical protein ACQPYH_06075 [Kribbella sp. CA-245084]|uniref:hypothetical protein n=1 Tax=Kribbella sp. CA-245084 TaxID=3239940 RepID=UPI003D8DB023
MAKTPVADILLVDGDVFENHVFRAPGAPTLQQLRERPTKAEYFQAIYSPRHKTIRGRADVPGRRQPRDSGRDDIRFLASDDPLSKAPIIAWLEERGLPFIDVGMGIEEVDGRLTGLLRATTSPPNWRDHAHANGRLPAADLHEDDYGRNIQTADLNALNAQLAIVRWKRHLGCFADLTRQGFSTYSVATNAIANEDQQP